MPHIVYIHGANATPVGFNYLRLKLQEHTEQNIRYDASHPIAEIIEDAIEQIVQPCHIVAHSMGGIIGVAISQALPDLILSVSTLATPFSGSEGASRIAAFLPFNTFLKNIRSGNPTIVQVLSLGAVVPTLNIITTVGQNFLERKANDGVVTVDSQMTLPNSRKVTAPLNHFEVMADPTVAYVIDDFISQHN